MSVLEDLLGPRRGFDGGLFLPDFKAVTSRRPIETMPATSPLRVPLTARGDLATHIEVRRGDEVRRGTTLASRAAAEAVAVHAPTSGRIVDIDRAWTAAGGFVDCAVLEPDGRNEAAARRTSWSSESLLQHLADHGVVSPSPTCPGHVLLQSIGASGASDLIINAMETEPYLASDLRTLVEQPGRLIDMTCELADALGAHRVIFALPHRHQRVVRRIRAEAYGRLIDVVTLSERYPQCHPIMLAKSLLDREVPPGGTVLDVGAAVLPLAFIRAGADAWFDDRPVTHAVVTVSGDAVARPGVYRVPIGTTVRSLAEYVGVAEGAQKAVSGGPLTGIALHRDDTVVTAVTTAILFFQTDRVESPVPCVRCGWCVEDCPVGVDPAELFQLEAQQSFEVRHRLGLSACIDCGLCSHVCPAALPLSAAIWRCRSLVGDSPEAS
jgi:electron transport complex protein RnfC